MWVRIGVMDEGVRIFHISTFDTSKDLYIGSIRNWL
jgi:hypothetical protein